MSNVKLKAPEGLSSFSYNGVEVELGKDGIVDVSHNPDMVEVMKAHGFTDPTTEVATAGKKRRAAE